MKRSSSKKGANNDSSRDFNSAFHHKYSQPNGIGLYGPGKIKINKEKSSVSSRGSARWNKSSVNSKLK